MSGADLCDTGNTGNVSYCDFISISIDMDIGGGVAVEGEVVARVTNEKKTKK
jgi:hypothetical protein